MRIFILIVAYLISGVLFAGTTDPNVDDKNYIKYGEKFVYIGKIQGKTQSNEPYMGSAIAYKDKLIITAAHVIHNSKEAFISINNKNIKEFQEKYHNLWPGQIPQ